MGHLFRIYDCHVRVGMGWASDLAQLLFVVKFNVGRARRPIPSTPLGPINSTILKESWSIWAIYLEWFALDSFATWPYVTQPHDSRVSSVFEPQGPELVLKTRSVQPTCERLPISDPFQVGSSHSLSPCRIFHPCQWNRMQGASTGIAYGLKYQVSPKTLIFLSSSSSHSLFFSAGKMHFRSQSGLRPHLLPRRNPNPQGRKRGSSLPDLKTLEFFAHRLHLLR